MQHTVVTKTAQLALIKILRIKFVSGVLKGAGFVRHQGYAGLARVDGIEELESVYRSAQLANISTKISSTTGNVVIALLTVQIVLMQRLAHSAQLVQYLSRVQILA